LRDRLLELTPTDSAELQAAWQAAAEGVLAEKKPPRSFDDIPEQFLLRNALPAPGAAPLPT